jgi:hypothetical protein
MKIRPCKYLNKFTAITVAPFGIWVRPDKINDKVTIKHESIHWKQQKRYWYIGFYFIYFFEWIFKGYDNISFEKEAYEHENDKQ